MRRRTGLAIGVVAVLIVLPVAVLAWYAARIDPEAVKARILAEVEHATGRELAIGGRLRLSLFPRLSLDADDVALANPAGFSRLAMVTAQHVHADIALLPLLARHVVVTRLVVTLPDLRLERPANGAPNWVFDRVRASASLPHAARPATIRPARLDGLTILDLVVTDGALSWRLPGQNGSLALTRIRLSAMTARSAIHVDVAAALAGDPVTLTGQLGGQAHLWDATDRSPWPVDLALRAAPGTLAVKGTLTAPLHLAGYDVSLRAQGPDLGRLVLLWPRLHLPRLADLTLDARLIDRRRGLDMPRLSLTAGASDLNPLVSGLTLNRVAIDAPDIDGIHAAPVNRVDIEGQYAGQELQFNATLGAVGRLFGRGEGRNGAPVAVDATASVAGAILHATGHVAPPGDGHSTDAAVTLRIPDLAPFAALAGRSVPALHDIGLDFALSSSGGVLSLVRAHLATPAADITATGRAALSGRPDYVLDADAARIDLDALGIGGAGASAAAPAPSAGPARADGPLPFQLLRNFDLDLRLAASGITYRGQHIDRLGGHLRLDHGRLALDPVQASLGGGMLAATLTIDAAAPQPRVTLDATATGLDFGSLLALAGAPDQGRGRLDVNAALTGSGATTQMLAAGLDGRLGLALTGGAVANAAVSRMLAALVPMARIGLPMPRTGLTAIACLATRLDLRRGIVVPRAFLLDAGRLRLAAAGGIDLGTQRVALRLRPYVRFGPAGIVVPVQVMGDWRAPRLVPEPAGGGASAASLAAGLAPGDPALAAEIAGLAGAGDAGLPNADTGDCGPALAAARGSAATSPATTGPRAAGLPNRQLR